MSVIPFTAPATPVTGMDVASYIRRVRVLLRDPALYADESFNGDGLSTDFLCTQFLINDDDFVFVSVGGTPVPYTTERENITAGNVFIDFESGRLIFGLPPASGDANVLIRKQRVDYRDSEIVDALSMGMVAMWPSVWQTYTNEAVQMQPLVWDYQLPPLFSQYEDVAILEVEIQPVPAGIPEPFRRLGTWEQIGNDTIKVLGSQGYSPGSSLRITYAGPYTDLSQLTGRLTNLPILYACGMLQGVRGARSTNNDVPAAMGNTNTGASQQAAGGFFMNQFYSELKQLARVIPLPPIRSTYVH